MTIVRDSRRCWRTPIAAETCTGDDGEPPPPRASIHDLPDELLELVLLRVRTPVCLFRAAATCKLWRRLIGGNDSFLQRLRPRHRPNHLLGHYSVIRTWDRSKGSSRTVVEFVPFPERPAVHLRERLSLDFPDEYMNNRPELTDSRGGLLAFVLHDTWWYTAIVCDPWTRQYKELRFPWPRLAMCFYDCLGAFILDAGDGERSLMSSFSVLLVCLITDKMNDTRTGEACVFSARDNNGWIRYVSGLSSNLCTDVSNVEMDQRFVGRAGGSIFFSGIKTIDNTHVLLVLDEATCEFSTITLPLPPDDDSADDRENIRVASGDDGGTLVRIVRLANDNLKVLKVTRDQRHGGWECTVEKSVDLCQAANIKPRWVIIKRPWRFLDTTTAAAAANRVLVGYSPCPTLLSLDLQTMKLWRVKKTTMTATTLNNVNQDYRVFPYELPWPQKIN